jgi:hypothetical protein
MSESDAQSLGRKYRGPAGIADVAFHDLRAVEARNRAVESPEVIDPRLVIERALEQYARLVLGNPRALTNENRAPDRFDLTLINAIVEEE